MKKNVLILVSLLGLLVFGNYRYLDVREYSINSIEYSKENIVSRDEEAEVDESIYSINPIWEVYDKLSDEEKAKWEAIPSKYVIEYKEPVKLFNSYGKLEPKATPASYDLRNVSGTSYVTPNKNQSILGLCWAFAANAMVESNILKLGLRTSSDPALFSERQIDYAESYPLHNRTVTNNQDLQVYKEGYNPYATNHDLGAGGLFTTTGLYFGAGVSPADSKGRWATYTTDYNQVSLSDVYNLDNQSYAVTDYKIFPSINNKYASNSVKASYRELIKNHIINYGGVLVATLAPQSSTSGNCYVRDTSKNMDVVNWTTSCESGYTSKPYDGTHAMTIVGWDDNYSLSYCAYYNGTTSTTVSENVCNSNSGSYKTINGAWILKNSWSSSSPYIYLGYDSYSYDLSGIEKTVERDFDYTYNILGPIMYTYNSDFSTSNRYYKTSEDEKLQRVTFETSTTSFVKYTAYYQVEGTSEWIQLGSKQVDTKGRYSIEANEPVLSGKSFSVKVVPSIKTSSYRPDYIYAFTSKVGNDTKVSSNTLFDPEPEIENGYNYYVMTKTTNLTSGDLITYKIYNSNNIDITSRFTLSANYVVNNAVSDVLNTSSILEPGKYKVETYYNDNLIGTNNFANDFTLDGSGTESDPYLIKNVSDLYYLATDGYNTEYYKLNDNIYLNEIDNFTPIGYSSSTTFAGVLDGDNHYIAYMTQTVDNSGLFYNLKGTVKNLKIEEATVTTKQTGGILTNSATGAHISRVSITGTLKCESTTANAGPFAGTVSNTNITESYSKTDVTGGVSGTFVGMLGANSSIDNSFNIGIVNATNTGYTSFYGTTESVNNSLTSMIDFNEMTSKTCESTVLTPSTSGTLTVTNNVVYNTGNCAKYGKTITDSNLRSASMYSGFDKTKWNIEDGKLPTLKNNYVHFTETMGVTLYSNLFIGEETYLDVTYNPEDATYPGYTIEEIGGSILTVVDYTLTPSQAGNTKLKVTATDGSHTSYTMDVHVFGNKIKNSVVEYDGIKLKDKVDSSAINDIIGESGLTIETPNKEYVGTGDEIVYKKDGQIVGSFIAVVTGDLSGDGIAASNDALAIRRYMIGLDDLSEYQIKAGDVDNNSLSSADALAIRRYVIGLEEELK